MEFILSAGLAGAGYLLNNNNNNNIKSTLISGNQLKNEENIYSSNYHNLENNKLKDKIKKNFDESLKFPENNIVPNKILIENNEKNDKRKITDNNTNDGIIISSLTGKPMTREEFKVETMVPFFGGRSQQNTYEFANESIIENHTGVSNYHKNKQEIEPMFNPKDKMSFIHGTPSMDNTIKERYNDSLTIKRQNEVPTKPILVGPGLNQGYTSLPSGGFHQENTRDYVLPKNIDELRSANNPRNTYEGRLIMGKKIDKPGLMGKFDKKLPDTFYLNTPDRYMTTVGAYTKEKQKPEIIIKEQNRKLTEKPYSGSAGPAVFKNPKKRPLVKKSNNISFKNSGLRNIGQVQGKWNTHGDWQHYGKNSITNKPNERETTQKDTPLANLVSLVKSIIMPIQDTIKTNKKENFIGNMRQTGNFQYAAPNKTTVYDPNDIARTTIKETNIHNNRDGQLKGPIKLTTYDPNDILRTTIKETNIHDNRSGNMGSNRPNQLPAYDPNDVARTTIKETNIHHNRSGNMGSNRPNQLPVHDPNDIARTTIKETNIHDNRSGNMGGNRPNQLPTYDPNDIARTTIKETNIHDNRSGNMGGNRPNQLPAYDPNDITRTTIKETNIHDNRSGNVGGNRPNQLPAYDPNDITRTTIKETNIHDGRTGNIRSKDQTYVIDPSFKAKTTVKETLENIDTEFNVKGHNKSTVYDPNDIAKTTIKETNIDNEREGNVKYPVEYGMGYLTNPKEAPNTNKQFTSNIEYTGNANNELNTQGGYKVANIEAPNTNKQFTSDSDYTGSANSANDKPMSYTDVYNATFNEIKEVISKNRNPTNSGLKVNVGEESVNMDIKKLERDNLNEREPISTKTYNSITQTNLCSLTKVKDNLDNTIINERLESDILKAYKENPYTHSLQSS